ncbi:hypothetical protein JCM6882_005449 [Rhodosporidiobolus microsporus]
MHKQSRAPPRPAGTPVGAVRAPLKTLAAQKTPTVRRTPALASRPPPAAIPAVHSSPLSSAQSLPPTPPAPKRGITTIKTTVHVETKVQKPPPPPTLNALKRPPPPPPKEQPPAKRSSKDAKKKKRAVASSSDVGSSSEDEKPLKKARRPTTTKKPKSARAGTQRSSSTMRASSSDLDPVTPSGDDESELSSPDEDYFAQTPKKAEGAPVVERAVAAQGEGLMDGRTGESLVLDNPTAYVEYFIDPDQGRPTAEWAGSAIPSVELEFPAVGASERFALLAPRTDDEYNPIEDVMRTILVTIDHYLTPEQAHLYFLHLPGKTSFSAFLYNKSSSSRSSTPSASTSKSSTPAPDSIPPSAPYTAQTSNVLLDTAAACAAGLPPPPTESLIRTLERARSKRDGPAFLAAVERFNCILRVLKEQGIVAANIAAMKGVKEKLWQKVFYQCYDRQVGPEVEKLREYEAFSSFVYGELLPTFLNEIFEKTHLGPGKVFVDLGSGVGNCVVQAALATGAESYGFELMAHASRLARLQLGEAEKRFRMWGLGGGAMKVVEGDFCSHPDVFQVMKKADVVLVNNEVFTSDLNQKLSWLFLELPPSAKIVSLKPFVSKNFKITSHSVGSPFAILAQSPPIRYKPGSVSWKMEGGTYFLSRVDRTRVERFERKESEREGQRVKMLRERKEKREGSSASTSAGTPGADGRASVSAEPMSRAPSRGAAA